MSENYIADRAPRKGDRPHFRFAITSITVTNNYTNKVQIYTLLQLNKNKTHFFFGNKTLSTIWQRTMYMGHGTKNPGGNLIFEYIIHKICKIIFCH